MTPRRIQLRRAKGWRKPPGAVVVARPGKWGNPYRVVLSPSHPRRWVVMVGFSLISQPFSSKRKAASAAVTLFHLYIDECLRGPAGQALRDEMDAELRGRDLACWCSLDDPCHGDVWLKVANR